jgi:hypothetical protein
MHRGRLMVAALAVTLAACGGSDAGDAGNSEPASDPTGSTVASPETTASTDSGDAGAVSGHRARVTVGDITYDLHSGGIFWVCGHSDTLINGSYVVDADGKPIQAGNPHSGVQINFVVLSPDSEDPVAPTITVDDVAGGFQWQTGEFADVPEASFVDWALEDGVAQGTAVFFDLRAYLAGGAPDLVEGSFEIVCDF